MLRHADVWQALDRLAHEHGLSASGLARKAGLDPTTFNRSKRIGRDGKQRWPSTESIAKVLTATGATIGEFVSYIGTGPGARGGVFRNVPLIGFTKAGTQGYFDDAGFPIGAGWEELPFPDLGDPHAYALEITGDSMEPVYRDGDIVIVSPESAPRRGDRVVVKTAAGEVMVKVLRRRTAHTLELASFNAAHPERVVPVDEIAWLARVVWASQ